MLRKSLIIAAATLCVLSPAATAQRLAGIAPSPSAPPTATPVWYPADCVGIDYCAPVEHVFWVAQREGRGPQLAVTSLHGTAVVQRSFAVQGSRDRQIHVCMRFDPFGDLEVTCLLVPES